ncbi:MAG: DUF1501 domain-containing protein [Planctomycetales bacterium]|nr:DUF1501 domain-containing protein [Planctomycetales bacterium]
MTQTGINRREFARLAAMGAFGASMSRWLPALANDTAGNPARTKSCILLWMPGGPSHIDTFDPKPDHANGGQFKPIATSVPGIQIGEHFPKLAQQMEHVVPIRSMTSKEGDHSRATYVIRTGYKAEGPVAYPTIGSVLSKALATPEAELPNYVSIGPYRFLNPAAYAPGFLGPKFAPLVVGTPNSANTENYSDDSLRVRNLSYPQGVNVAQADARLNLLDGLEADFAASRPGVVVDSHQTAYRQAVRMMRSEAVQAFDLSDEKAALRDAYGRNQFGQGCLLARRLVERGVPFVEVSLNGVNGSNSFAWDTHVENFAAVKALCEVLDPAWATLIADLKHRGLLDSTLIVWMGEFGRTPRINGSAGRDHFPNAWSAVLSGGGIRGGQVVGKTSPDGESVEDRPVVIGDLMSTISKALGVDPMQQNISNVGRPIRIADPEAKPLDEVLL